jgi:hypothetical protein
MINNRHGSMMNLPYNKRWLILIAALCLVLLVVVGLLTMQASASPTPVLAHTTGVDEATVTQTFWGPFRYINVAGSSLRPRASGTEWTYPGGGCISAALANDVFLIHLPIPNGSRIDYLRIYYYDTSANNSQAWVTTYNGAGSFNDLTTVNSAGNSGYGTQLSPYVGHVVDTASNSYVLNWRSNQTGSTMRLCGLRVAYRMPLDQKLYLPGVLR